MSNKSTNSQTIIAEDVQIDGDMNLSGNITIYGEIRGSVSTHGSVQLAKNGKIFGDVKATAIQMNGYVEGDIYINGTAELLSNCELVGDLRYKVLNIQDGAQFSGRCEMIDSEIDSDLTG
ncbi:MAG: polymer-forming cytoskeletal protein [Candidatus Neomarinimicrobiota bacterium]|nr:polymer-forming cytoskeletal protein [Candidatus Neomarinimicrobiota bacterium]